MSWAPTWPGRCNTTAPNRRGHRRQVRAVDRVTIILMRARFLLPVAVLVAACQAPAVAPPPRPAEGVQFHVGPYTVPAGGELNQCETFHLDDTLLVDGIETWTSERV